MSTQTAVSKARMVHMDKIRSILGPLLFIPYVNDLPKKVRCGIQMFADDTKLWTTVQKVDDQAKLQNDLHSLEDWSKTWLLKFNCNK